jgi:hypothetical protein
MKWGKTISKLQCSKRLQNVWAMYCPVTCWPHDKAKFKWGKLPGSTDIYWICHTSHAGLFVIPTSIPTHTMTTIHTRLINYFPLRLCLCSLRHPYVAGNRPHFQKTEDNGQ